MEFPHTHHSKGNDATLFALFKPFIFLVFFLIIFLKPLQTKLREDIIQMCLSILSGGEGEGGCCGSSLVQLKMNHFCYNGTVNTLMHLSCPPSAGFLQSGLSFRWSHWPHLDTPPFYFLPQHAHSTCKPTILSDVQYKATDSYRPSTLRLRAGCKEGVNCKYFIYSYPYPYPYLP